jgi:hypothetical protein
VKADLGATSPYGIAAPKSSRSPKRGVWRGFYYAEHISQKGWFAQFDCQTDGNRSGRAGIACFRSLTSCQGRTK